MQHIQRNITKATNRLAINYPMNETFSALIGVDLITDQVFVCQPYQAGEVFIRQPATETKVYFIKTDIRGRMPEWHAA